MTSTGTGEVVLAMAGHVDHGKSALVGALTGQRTDRRRAEQQRGLTVDLGHLVLAGARPVAVTDVPGHVDYLGNTLVGLAGATHALLVVAADDGWMPQTEDHVRAARQLDVPVSVVAVTKADLAEPERVADVATDVRHRLAGPTGLPTVVPVSVVDGRGLDLLRDALAGLEPPDRPATAPRLWVDRAFHVDGRGLVVAGSLAQGRLAVGDRVTVAPSGKVGRVRALQQHGRTVDAVTAPGRVAIDLADAPAARGDRLLSGSLGRDVPATSVVDAWLNGQHPTGIGDRGAWVVHVGASSAEAEVHPVEREPIRDGEEAAVQLRLARPLPLVVGDRFVVRDVGRRVVAGGGAVLDPAPAGRARGRAARHERAAALAAIHGAPEPVMALVEADGGLAPAARVVTAVADPAVATEVVAGHVASPAWRARLATHVHAAVAAGGGAGRPVDAVVADAVARLGAPAPVVRAALSEFDGVTRQDTRLVVVERRGDLDAARRASLAALHARLRRAPLAPDPLEALAQAAGVTPPDLDRLVREGKVLRSGPYGFLPAAVDVVVDRLRELQDRVGAFSVADARDVLGITRKHAVPWMELLDRLGATTREGDRRRLSPAAGSPRPSPTRTDR